MMLYHYCSNETFLKIIENEKIRLTDLSMSNDSMEGLWIVDVFSKAWDEFDGLPNLKNEVLDRLKAILEAPNAYGLCLSKDGDLLSQWRGYGADATGIAIGFDENSLKNIQTQGKPELFEIEIAEIDYIENKPINELDEQQINKLKLFFNQIKNQSDSDGLKKHTLGIPPEPKVHPITDIHAFSPLKKAAFTIKTYDFHEEQEVRFLTSTFYPHDGRVSGAHSSLSYFTRDTHIVPYLTVPLSTSGIPPIKEIIIGPRNTTPEYIIRGLLEKYGFKGVNIGKSESFYRKR